MGTYVVRFTPLEPYFFGNEKTFGYGSVRNRAYYIESDKLPSQSGLFGTLRYCCITDQEKRYISHAGEIGEESFDIRSEKIQGFGKIHRMSPLFLEKGGLLYITLPADHKINDRDQYQPFSQYMAYVTEWGERYMPQEYECKEGIQSGFMGISEENRGSILADFSEDGVLYRVERTGINTQNENQGLFRKVYYMLKPDYSFMVLADIDGKVEDQLVYMGRDKSVFRVSFKPADSMFQSATGKYEDYWEELTDMILQCFRQYNKSWRSELALSDLYIPDHMEKIYENCCFAFLRTADYRSFATNYSAKEHADRFRRGEKLQKMIKAGSIFILDEKQPSVLAPWENSVTVKNARQIGYNITICSDGQGGTKI